MPAAIIGLIEFSHQSQRDAILFEARAAVDNIFDANSRLEALSSLIQYLSGAERAATIHEAFAMAKALRGNGREIALARLIEYVPEAEREASVTNAIAASKGISDLNSRVDTLSKLLPHIKQSQRRIVVSEILVNADASSGASRTAALKCILPYLPNRLDVFGKHSEIVSDDNTIYSRDPNSPSSRVVAGTETTTTENLEDRGQALIEDAKARGASRDTLHSAHFGYQRPASEMAKRG